MTTFNIDHWRALVCIEDNLSVKMQSEDWFLESWLATREAVIGLNFQHLPQGLDLRWMDLITLGVKRFGEFSHRYFYHASFILNAAFFCISVWHYNIDGEYCVCHHLIRNSGLRNTPELGKLRISTSFFRKLCHRFLTISDTSYNPCIACVCLSTFVVIEWCQCALASITIFYYSPFTSCTISSHQTKLNMLTTFTSIFPIFQRELLTRDR